MSWMSREEPQLCNVHDLPWRSVDEIELLAGVPVRRLSRDDRNGSFTAIADLPAGWSAGVNAEGMIELLVLEGTLSAGPFDVGASGFFALPPGERHALRSHSGAIVLCYYSPAVSPEHHYAGQLYATQAWREQWVIGDMPGLCNGRMYKPLRVPDPIVGGAHGGPGGLLHLVMQVPGFHWEKRESHHEAWEEIVFFSGDNLMPGRGFTGPGTYLANPAGFVHGVMMSQRGSYMVRHSNAPVTNIYTPLPGGEALTSHYLESTSLLEPPRTEPWADRPERAYMLEHSAEYRAWEEATEARPVHD